MAIPPRPLEDRLRDADLVVDADVVIAPPVEPRRADGQPIVDGLSDQGIVFDEQMLTLSIRRVLRGAAGTDLVVCKPFGPMAFGPAFKGVFLLRTTDGVPQVVDGLPRGSGQAASVVESLTG